MPADNWTRDGAFCNYPDYRVLGTHHLFSVTWEQASLTMLWAKARQSCQGLRRGRLGKPGEVSFWQCPPLEVVAGARRVERRREREGSHPSATDRGLVPGDQWCASPNEI